MLLVATLKNTLRKIDVVEKANHYIQRDVQSVRIAIQDRVYQHLARLRGLPEGGLGIDRLRELLQQRIGPRRPKEHGSLHIFIAYYYSSWEDVLAKSLRSFGTVDEFEWRSEGFDDAAPTWQAARTQMNARLLEAFWKAHARSPVDVFVGYLSGHNVSPDVLRAVTRSGAVVLNLCLDDRLHFPGAILGGRFTSPAAIAQAVDLNLTNNPAAAERYWVHGGLSLFWPEAAYPPLYNPVPFEKRDLPLVFIGGCYGGRRSLVEGLRRAGLSISCYGPGWPNGPVSAEAMADILARAKIVLGFSSIGHSRYTCLKGRDFEATAAGALYLTEWCPDLQLVFDVGSEIVTYRSKEECVRLICELQDDEPRAARIASAGQRRCLTEHSYASRWSSVFRLIGLME